MKKFLPICIAGSLPFFWLILTAAGIKLDSLMTAFLSGFAIVGSAFLLSWATESAQKDISKGFAIAILAFIAVLPEYAVDLYFAWTAGKNPAYTSYATANMTGANRLLIGIGWSLLVFLFWLKKRKQEIVIDKEHYLELIFLAAATLYSFVIPIKGTISIIDAFVFLSIFVAYILKVMKAEVEEPDLIGTAKVIGDLPKKNRIVAISGLFVFSALSILAAVEPFAESLLAVGKRFNIEEFILVQWIAPLASEAPEIIIASIFVLKLKPGASMGTLISSKVNQWTLLIGMLPLAFIISKGHIAPMHLDARQVEEILLTSSQSLFAIMLFINLRLSLKEASVLFVLFASQLAFPSTEIRYIYSAVYIALAFFVLIKNYKNMPSIMKDIKSVLKAKS